MMVVRCIMGVSSQKNCWGLVGTEKNECATAKRVSVKTNK